MVNPLANWLLRSLITTFITGTAGHAVASEMKLTLVIYNHAQMPGVALANTKNTVSQIFTRADVQLIWHDGFAHAAEQANVETPLPEHPATLVINLQPASSTGRYGRRPECEGIGLSSAIIFVHPFDGRDKASATRLGYIIAHELGHILLGPNAHSLIGIMRRRLLLEDWEKAAQGRLEFTRSQNQQIRNWVADRSLHSGSTHLVSIARPR